MCPAIDLRTPAGDRVSLTGQWRANDFGEYYLSQHDSCLFWMGRSPALLDLPVGHFWDNVFTGRIGSDFTIEGSWGDVPLSDQPSLGNGELTLGIDFFEANGTSWPTLHLIAQRPGETFGGQDFVPEASLPALTEYVGTYGYDTPDCPWVEVDGDRYEITEWQYDIARDGQIIGDGSQVLVRPGDPIRVEAQISASLGPNHCQPSSMLVWDLQPSTVATELSLA